MSLERLSKFAQVVMRYFWIVPFGFGLLSLNIAADAGELTLADWSLLWLGIAILCAVFGSWQ